MQIYTKIMLGMFVGALVGLTLGPSSVLLDADTYKVGDAGSVTLLKDRHDATTQLTLPAGYSMRLRIVEEVKGVVEDGAGGQVATQWVKVTFPFSQRLALRDPTGALRTQLGSPKVGGQVEAWLQITHKPLAGGGVSTWPTPISGFGDALMGWVNPVGQAFIRLIRMVIVPLVFASLLVGVASLGDARKLGRLGAKTLILYTLTTVVAVSIGLSVASMIRPGDFIDEAARAVLMGQFDAAAGMRSAVAGDAPSVVGVVLGVIPTNPVASLASGEMLPIIFFAVIFGIALTLVRGAQPVIDFFDKVQAAMIAIIHVVMKLAPFGAAALIAEVVGSSGLGVLKALLVYGVTVLLGLLLHVTFVYGGLLRFWARVSVRDFFRATRPAYLVAFSTSSSAAALPVTLECAEKRLGISNSVASFVLPLGATVNMDGGSLYQGVSALFIAQIFQIDLSLGAQLGIVATATMASVGAAGVPGTGVVMMAMVLTSAGIPTAGVALILGMDRLIEMFRTAVNVTGDACVTAVVASSEGETLRYAVD